MSLRIVFVGLIVLLAPMRVAAQGMFEAFPLPKTVVATGQTEVIGAIQLALRQGPTQADTLIIDVAPYRITNASASDIRLSAAGDITTGTVVIEAADGRVRIPFNAGAASGSVRIEGIRVAVAGTNATAIDARLKWANSRNFLTPATSVRLVDQVQSGLAVDPGDNRFLIYGNTVIDNSADFIVREGFATAFTSSTEFGQNAPTRLKIRITDLPTGLSFTFPATATSSDSASTLTTVEGTNVTVPRADGTAEVTYNFNGAANSTDTLESFKIPYTVSVQGTVGVQQPTIDVTLASIGAPEPSTDFPSSDIPRFSVDYLNVLEGTSRIVTKTMYWTGIDTALANTLSVSNPSPSATNLTITAFRADGQLLSGTNVMNSVKRSLSANQSLEESLQNLFGTSAGIATVRVESTNSASVALGTAKGTGMAESVPLLWRGTVAFAIPNYDQSGRVFVFNPNNTSITGTLRLLNPQGAVLGTKSLTVAPHATSSGSVSELFQLACITVVPSVCDSGQIVGSFENSVITVVSSGSANTLNLIAAQPAAEISALYVPFFASGNGFESDLTLINVSDQTVTVSAQILSNQGNPVGSPESITLAPSLAFGQTVAQLFKLQGFTTGYIRISIPQMAKGPWYFYPAIQGFIRIRTDQASTIVSLSGYPLRDGVVLNSGTGAGEYQGLAIVNPNSSAVTVTLDVLTASGAVSQSQTLNLGPNQLLAQLISQIFPAAVPPGSVIRVNATALVVTTSITATLDGAAMRSTTTLK